jgi:hypothetical protein
MGLRGIRPYNGSLLYANLDALFDKYLISFSDDGKLLISDLLPVEERRRLGLSEDKSVLGSYGFRARASRPGMTAESTVRSA